MHKKSFFFLILLLSICSFTAKTQALDSLLNLLSKHHKEDTLKLDLINNIAKEYQYSNTTRGLQTADTAIALARRVNDKTRLAEAYLMKAQNYYRQNN